VSVTEEGIGVGLEDPDLAVGGQADVEPGIVAQPERPERGAADGLDPLSSAGGDRTGKDVADPPAPVKKSLYTLFVAILLSGGLTMVQSGSIASVQKSSSDTARFITWTYKETPMGLYVPVSTGKPLPVVMYLHYCSGSPVYPGFWITTALNTIEPCAVFLPTAPALDNNCADWGGTYDADLRNSMINALHELDSLNFLFGFDTNRQYVYGESMGGEGVYRLLMDFPARFAGAVAVVGYTKDKGADKMAQTPLWILHGAEDEINSVEADRTIYQSILNAGGNKVKYTEYPELGHTPAMEHARTEPGLLAWLLSQQRSTAIIARSSRKIDTFRNNVHLACHAGKMHFSSPLPNGTILTLFDFTGRVMRKSIMSEASFSIPPGIANRVALWHVSHPTFSASGKITLD
jgi:hypothetical protein